MNKMYNLIELCYERDLSVYECLDTLAEEYSHQSAPSLATIREIYRECKETYDRF